MRLAPHGETDWRLETKNVKYSFNHHWGCKKSPAGHCSLRGRLRFKCDGTRTETRFRLSKRTSPFKSAVASVQSTIDSWGVRISGSNSGYTMFRGSVKSTGYPFHSPVSPSLPLPCVTVCHHISTGLLRSLHSSAVFIWSAGMYRCVSWLFEKICPLHSKMGKHLRRSKFSYVFTFL